MNVEIRNEFERIKKMIDGSNPNDLPQFEFEVGLEQAKAKYANLISKSYEDAKQFEETYKLIRNKGLEWDYDLSNYPETLEVAN